MRNVLPWPAKCHTNAGPRVAAVLHDGLLARRLLPCPILLAKAGHGPFRWRMKVMKGR